ncbi:hypothetical protein [Plastoroseomonas hellenica]|uniref:hypothetical protein n=1 Tax=Plastoroseomonas hellenica TaxID=2687306 RepID=UPI001BAD3EC2|nr:hypothetical protein [Plastoroseomonas hellenica]MBR0641377.1 hypothetical protein [Plastoroseomonas hellenica]
MAQGIAFRATDEQRRTVKTMAGFGVPQEDIAKHIEIDPKTLRLHFRRELDAGVLEANAKVAQALFHMATQGKNVAAAIFRLKARAGWREKQEIELSTEPAEPKPVESIVTTDPIERVYQRIMRGED